MTKRKIQYWVIPPEADAEFIASMEEILDTYEKPYDADYPVLCMDEQPVQLHKEIRRPIPATKNHARRVDYEYERCGTASVFMLTEPLSGWRQATARKQRTKVDWALEMAALLDGRYKQAQKVIVVCDDLNTHTKGAFADSLREQFSCCFQLSAESTFFWAFGDTGGGHSWNEYATQRTSYTPVFLGPDSVTAGKHMEAIRESVGDFEYLTLLRRRVAELSTSNPGHPDLGRAKTLLADAADRVLDAKDATDLGWRTYKDRTAADTVRIEIGNLLENKRPFPSTLRIRLGPPCGAVRD